MGIITLTQSPQLDLPWPDLHIALSLPIIFVSTTKGAPVVWLRESTASSVLALRPHCQRPAGLGDHLSSLLLLVARDQQHAYHLVAYLKCAVSGSSPDLENQNQQVIYMFTGEREKLRWCTSSQAWLVMESLQAPANQNLQVTLGPGWAVGQGLSSANPQTVRLEHTPPQSQPQEVLPSKLFGNPFFGFPKLAPCTRHGLTPLSDGLKGG